MGPNPQSLSSIPRFVFFQCHGMATAFRKNMDPDQPRSLFGTRLDLALSKPNGSKCDIHASYGLILGWAGPNI